MLSVPFPRHDLPYINKEVKILLHNELLSTNEK